MSRSESVRSSAAACVVLAVLAAADVAEAQDPSDAIYDEDQIATYRITNLSAAAWDAICNEGAGAGDQWYRADLTWQRGTITETIPGVGVKRSGGHTRHMDTPKPSIRISFNEFEFANPAGPGTPGRKWRGVNRIKLDSMVGNTDPSLMRDRVAYGIFRALGAKCPRACHGRLYVNGAFKGLYTVEEPIRKDFLRYHYGEESGNLYKGGHVGLDAYDWKGADPASYVPTPFAAETNYPGGDYRDLVNFMNDINNFPVAEIRTRLGSRIDVDGFLRYLAVTTAYGDNDDIVTWGAWGTNNHFWYHRAATNRLEIIKWDPGASQGMYDRDHGLTWGQSAPLGYKYETIKATAWVKSDPTSWAIYRTKIREVLDGPIASIAARIDTIYNQIRSHAYEDPLKGQYTWWFGGGSDLDGFTDAEFDAGVASLKEWYRLRTAYLRSQVGTATLPTVTITASANAAEPSTAGSFTVTRTGSTAASLSVVRSRSGTATSGTDFQALPSPIVIPAGQASVVVRVTPIDDSLVEGPETVILTISPDPAYTVGTASSATVTIADDDTAPPPPPPTLPTVTIAASDPDAAEPSAPGAFTVTRTGPTTNPLSVYRTRTGSAQSGVDFSPLPNPMVIPAGQASVVVTVTPIDDTLVEGSETVILTLDPNAAYTVGNPSSATVTIADDDAAPPPPTTLPTVTITASDPDAAEPSATGAFTVTRTGSTTNSLSVVRVRSGTATSGTDFQGLPSPLVIPAGQASVTVILTPIDDTAVEGSETVTLTLSPDPAYTVGTPSSATVTIADDDAATGGLSGTYYDNPDFTGTSVTRTDGTVDFNWADGSPAAGIGPDTFSIRWTGRVRAQYSETYTFYTFTNDGVRLWVEGELLVDKWVQQSGGVEWSAQVALQGGRWYTVQMDYYEGVGNSVARLLWSSPSTPKQVIPRSALDPALGAPDSRDNDGDGVANDADLDDDNDGVPDLQDPDRDGDGVTNLAEIASGSDPDDRTSPNGAGAPPVAAAPSDGDNPNGHGPFLINDKCGGSTGVTPAPAWALLLVGMALLRIRRDARP
jgi:hypothetical protein